MATNVRLQHLSSDREYERKGKRKLNMLKPNKSGKESKTRKNTNSNISDVTKEDVEKDFPRGGALPLTPLEVREVKNEAEKDVLFGVMTPTKEKKSKRKKKISSDSVFDGDVLKLCSREDANVDSVTFKKLSVGALLLGVVEEVFEVEMVISLPNNLSGCVHITDVNPLFTSLLEEDYKNEEAEHVSRLSSYFPVGTMVRCAVLSTDSTKHGYNKIKLTINPEVVNCSMNVNSLRQNMTVPGYISNVEDHGYSISLGIKGVQGFISEENATGGLHIGQVLAFIISSTSSDKRMVQLKMKERNCAAEIIKYKEKILFSSLLPGMLVKATVKQINTHGVILSFLGGFHGSIDLIHLAKHAGKEPLDTAYLLNSKVSCCITYINPSNKTVVLSNLGHLVNEERLKFSVFNIGDVIEDACVVRVYERTGLLLELNDSCPAFVHISRLADEKVVKIDNQFKSGTKHRCRILSFNSMVGLALVTFEKSILDQPFIRYKDIKPGVIVNGRIQSLLKSGMLVALSDYIRGYCPSFHYADVALTHPEKKFHEGKKIKCRVLEVIAEKKRLLLTHKKSLVNSEFPAITSLHDVELGMKIHGFITSIRDYGCIVHFYNNIHGLIPKAELGLKSNENPNNSFYIGQVVTCVVTSCSVEKGKLTLSLNTSATPFSKLAPGMLVDVDIVGRTDTGLDVQIKPSNRHAFIPLAHMSDHISNCSALLDVYAPIPGKELKTLNNVLFYGKDKDKSLMVTCKQSLIKSAMEGTLLKNFEDLKVGMILPGFTRQLMPYGVFVEISPNRYGLAPNSLLSSSYVADASQYFTVGQSVMAKITEIDCERRRLLVSLKSCDVYPDQSEDQKDDKHSVDLLIHYLKERDIILESLRSKDENCFINVTQGSLVLAKITSITNCGISFLLENGVVGFSLPQLTRGTNLAVGEVLDTFVLDHDLENKRLNLVADSNLIRECKDIKSKNKKKLNCGEVVSAVVYGIGKEYLVVTLPNHGLRIAYIPVKSNMNDIRDARSRFKLGQTCDATVERYVRSNMKKQQYLILSVAANEETVEVIKPGCVVNAVITSIKGVQLNVHIGVKKYKGRVCVTEITDDVSVGKNPMCLLTRGQRIQAKILGFRDSAKHNFLPITHRNFSKSYAELSTKASRLREDEDENHNEMKSFEKIVEDYKEGEKIVCFVKTIHDHDIWMVVSTSVNGRVQHVDISSDIKVLKDLSKHFKIGSAHYCSVLSVNKENKSLDLSMSDCLITKGDVVPGKITKILPHKGFAVQLPHKKHGTVFLTDICDHFNENPVSGYEVNQIISCYVLAEDNDNNVPLSTRTSRTDDNKDETADKDIQSFNDIDEGDIVRGYVKTVSDVGVFVSLSRKITARVQIKNLSHYFVKNWKPLFPIGKLVKGKILSIDPNNNNIELSLKGKDVGDKDPAPKPERRVKEGVRKRNLEDDKISESDDETDRIVKKLKKDDKDQSIDEVTKKEEITSSEDTDSDDEVNKIERPTLKISGFNWHSVTSNADTATWHAEDRTADSEDELSEEVENSQIARKKSKRAKRAAKKAEEEFLYKTEQALLNKDKGPQTADDFDRVLLATPNDSLLWLQYIAFYLHMTEIEKARAVAERGLKSISFREEEEKFNVWIALLNLENCYGTQDSLIKVFQRAVESNEPKKVFKQLVAIYVKSNKVEQAEQLYQTMVKRFKSSKKVWIDYAAFLMGQGELQSARNLLERSFKSLEKRKHIETITRFALLEFKHGETERGKTLLDNVLMSYPKRTDIWSLYIDVLAKNEDITAARRVFEKAIASKLSSKKMKIIFKKYLEFEKRHGDESTVDNVKKIAEEYVRGTKAG